MRKILLVLLLFVVSAAMAQVTGPIYIRCAVIGTDTAVTGSMTDSRCLCYDSTNDFIFYDKDCDNVFDTLTDWKLVPGTAAGTSCAADLVLYADADGPNCEAAFSYDDAVNELEVDSIGIGRNPDLALDIQNTSAPQLRVRYDFGNVFDISVASNSDTSFNTSSGTFELQDSTTITAGNYLGVGVASSADAVVHALNATIDQLRLSNTATEYCFFDVASDAGLTIDCTGSSPDITFADDVIFSGAVTGVPINSLADSTGDGTVRLGDDELFWLWTSPDPTVKADFEGLRLSLDHGSVTDGNAQRILAVERAADVGVGTAVEALIRLENKDAEDTVNDGIIIRSAAGLIDDAIDVRDSNITNVISFDTGFITHTDLEVIDEGIGAVNLIQYSDGSRLNSEPEFTYNETTNLFTVDNATVTTELLIPSGTSDADTNGELVIDTDGNTGATPDVINDVLVFRAGGESFYVPAAREYPTADHQVLNFQDTAGEGDFEWAGADGWQTITDGTTPATADVLEDTLTVNDSTTIDFVTGDGPETLTASIIADSISESLLDVTGADSPSDEECLTFEATGGTGDFEWQPCGSGSPGGADTQVQFNESGAFGGDAEFVYDTTNKEVGIGSGITGTGDVDSTLHLYDLTGDTDLTFEKIDAQTSGIVFNMGGNDVGHLQHEADEEIVLQNNTEGAELRFFIDCEDCGQPRTGSNAQNTTADDCTTAPACPDTDCCVMTDSKLGSSYTQLTIDALVGWTITNITDNSSCTVARNTATTVSCDERLSGGTDDDWDVGDQYKLHGDTNSEVFTINGTGDAGWPFIGINNPNPEVAFDFVGKFGQVRIADNTNDNANKIGRFTLQHYDTDEQDVMVFTGQSGSGSNNIFFGGGTGSNNAATTIKFITAANTTTLNGTSVVVIRPDQEVAIGPDFAISDALLHLDNDTADTDLYIEKDAGTNAGIFFRTGSTNHARIEFDSSENLNIDNTASTGDQEVHINNGRLVIGEVGQQACLLLRDSDDAGWTECEILNGGSFSCAEDSDGVADCDGT